MVVGLKKSAECYSSVSLILQLKKLQNMFHLRLYENVCEWFNEFTPGTEYANETKFLAVVEMLSNKGKASTCNIERQQIEIDPMAVLADSKKDRKKPGFL
jgi:hypothetical protein